MPSDEAIQRATGHAKSHWFACLDRYGLEIGHTERARRFSADHPDLSGWWVQSLTVEFERERGLRQVGQTASGFQVSCSRTLHSPPMAVWEALVAALGPHRPGPDWREGAHWTTQEAQVEVRRVDPPRLLRWFWHDGQGRSTVEVSLQDRDDRCTVTIRHHGLPDEAALQKYRVHWRAVLDDL